MKNTSIALKTSFLFIFLLFAFIPTKANNAPPIINLQNPIDSFIDIIDFTTAYIDKSTQSTFEDVLKPNIANQFLSASQIEIAGKFENGKYRYWIHFILKNASSEAITFNFKANSVDSTTLYIQDDTGYLQTVNAGRWTHGTKNKIQFPTASRLMIPITIAPQTELKCWARLMNEYGFNSRLYAKLYHPEFEIRKYTHAYLRYKGFLLGFFIVLLFLTSFNLILYAQNRDKAFLFYGLYTLFVFLFYLRESSYFDHFTHFIPIVFYQYKYYSLFGTAMFICYYFFVDHFIDAKNKFPKFHHYIKLLVGTTLIYLIVLQIIKAYDPNLGYRVMHYGRYFIGSIHFVGLIWMLTRKDKMVKYVLIGTCFLFAGSTMTFLESYLDLVNDKWWDADQIFAFIGIFIEVFFFTILLGHRQFLVQKEKSRIESELIYKEKEAQQLKSLDEMKTNFFTNITHEFRTPLTVIHGMTAEIKGNTQPKKLIKKNSDQLLSLINQILDFSKIEAGKMPMKWIQADIIDYINYLTESMQSFAFSKKVNLIFYSELETLKMDFDAEKIQMILYNLISNAIKFTPEYGKVLLVGKKEAIAEKSFFILKISDNGIGISAEELPRIFKKYYQSQLSDEYGGTGIGLALVKELTEMHGGKIAVKSEPQKGTSFTISFPISQNAKEAIPPNSTHKEESIGDKEPSLASIMAKNAFSATKKTEDLPSLLIIEDNTDVVQYLKAILEETYAISIAKNGKLGIESALSIIPDLIISDVMMPEKDGFEVCKTLKLDERTSHIPVILLTAKATRKDKMEGLRHGADAYLMKPFEKEELLIRLEKLNELRQRLQAKYSDFSTSKNVAVEQQEVGLSLEEIFLQKLHQIIRENINSENLNTLFLGKKLGMSNTQLYRKLKALTGFSIGNYVRHCRLEFAHDLLKKSDEPVSDIAYQTGFTNLSWFSQAFKEKYGYTPSELRN